ncbi:thiamine ABC transporter permease [Vibrio sp. DW001]|uniref:ABC transporter permease n=1 Tax=Vibrio sp. DW001 TaxID=2912315 RepID=UPI0023B11AD0|nr:thiamine ABC transporter permease [Vibrio sp. DW001]WED27946.1 thiamine ABC transporter permease [Vibrio sp. DW001]
MLRLFYSFVILICIAPIIPGVLGVVLSALSYIPSLGFSEVSLNGFADVFAWSGVTRSLYLTVFTSLTSSYLACFITFAVLQTTWNTRAWKWVTSSLAPLLAVPHIAFAIGFAFLFSPTGIAARILSPILGDSDFSYLVNDQNGIGLTLALALKELPFLLLMSIPITQQLKLEESYKVATSLGYSQAQFWWKCVLPQWLTKIRFSLLAIIAYSASVVDMSLILGPTNPPTFAVLVWQWFSEPDLTLFPRAAAGAVILFIVCTVLILLTKWLEHLIVRKQRTWQISGRVGFQLRGMTLFLVVALINILILPITLLWSVAQRWRFPDLLPSQFSHRFWQQEWDTVIATINTSLFIALVSASLALVFALIAHEYKKRYRLRIPNLIIATPMLVPQLSLLFGLQVSTLYINVSMPLLWVVWSHIFFAFPYVYLALDGPWRSYNDGYSQTALSLGKTPWQVWFKVKMPILFPAISFAWAVGAGVSLAQYLPTLMLGSGRVITITTEAVALSSGSDRRVMAIYALWQAILPLLFFTFAFVLNRLQRKGLTPIRKRIFNEPLSKKPHHL